MTDTYTEFDVRQLADVMEAQLVIAGNKSGEKAAGGKVAKIAKGKTETGKKAGQVELKIVKMSECENRAAQMGT
jgi:hypothetical protein